MRREAKPSPLTLCPPLRRLVVRVAMACPLVALAGLLVADEAEAVCTVLAVASLAPSSSRDELEIDAVLARVRDCFDQQNKQPSLDRVPVG